MRRAYRLRSAADFQRVRAARRSWANRLLVLNTAPNELGHPRLGVAVSRRVGKAVVRNLVRRRIRAAVGARLAHLEEGADLLFVARGPSASATWTELRNAVDDLLRRCRLLSSAQSSPLGGA